MSSFVTQFARLGFAGLATAALLFTAVAFTQQPRIPIDAHAFERYLLQQEYDRRNSTQPSAAWPGNSLYPWRRPGYRGYSEPYIAIAPPSSWSTASAPQKYTITIEPLPQTVAAPDSKIAFVMAHVPEEAVLWFQGQLMSDKGDMRLFRSPPLIPGAIWAGAAGSDVNYQYEVKIAWPENGKWVIQTRNLAVHAGNIHCLYIATPEEAVAGAEAKVRESLAKLSPEDHKLAEQQKFCAVQNTVPLGSMGVPVKTMVNGQPVFLCCAGCTETAQANPERTLATVRDLQAAKASP